MKKLPYISIEGVGQTPEEKLQSLIEFEPVLYLLGYKPRESWNNVWMKTTVDAPFPYLVAHLYPNDGLVCYYQYAGSGNPKRFLVTDRKNIIEFVLEFAGR